MSIPPHAAPIAAREPVGPFWRRQFAGAPTPGQTAYDVACGIVLPIFCFLADPGIFRDGLASMSDWDLPLRLAVPVYALGAVSVAVLTAWLLARGRAPLLAGPLLAGAVGSAAIGVLIGPYTVLGLFVLIGVLGFAPFLTAFAFLRNGVRALRAPGRTPSRAALSALAALVLSIGLPLAATLCVRDSIDGALRAVRSDRAADREGGMTTLRRLRSLVRRTDFAAAAEGAPAPEEERLRRAYEELTGLWSFEPGLLD